jgi:hypothetical protein
LDCKLFVDNPEQFEIALSSLESFKNAQKFEEHLCLLGYGDDTLVNHHFSIRSLQFKDMYLNMALARLLRKGTAHVSMVQGGFRSLHRFLLESKRLRLLDGHTESKCVECNPAGTSSWVFLFFF